jgi:hypothetical protein
MAGCVLLAFTPHFAVLLNGVEAPFDRLNASPAFARLKLRAIFRQHKQGESGFMRVLSLKATPNTSPPSLFRLLRFAVPLETSARRFGPTIIKSELIGRWQNRWPWAYRK